MKNMKYSFLVIPSMLVAASSLAAVPRGSLAGSYGLTSPCALTKNFAGETTVVIPAGKVVVTENVPVRENDLVEEHPAIIFQAGDDFHAILSLGIGRATQFAYGPEIYSVGSYSEGGSVFTEMYSPSQSDGHVEFLDTIRLQRTNQGLILTSVDHSVSPSNPTVVCYLSEE